MDSLRSYIINNSYWRHMHHNVRGSDWVICKFLLEECSLGTTHHYHYHIRLLRQGEMEAQKSPIYPLLSSGPKPLHFRGLTLGRLDKFESGPYTNIRNVLYEERIDSEDHIQLEYWSSPGRTKVSSSLLGFPSPN